MLKHRVFYAIVMQLLGTALYIVPRDLVLNPSVCRTNGKSLIYGSKIPLQ